MLVGTRRRATVIRPGRLLHTAYPGSQKEKEGNKLSMYIP